MAITHYEHALRQLCQAQPQVLVTWLSDDKSKLWLSIMLLLLGGAIYGASLGLWRSPLQSVYVAIKFPLLLSLIALGNALINAMLAQLMGAPITFRQSLLAVLMSFALLAAILAAFTPLNLFLLYHLQVSIEQSTAYNLYGIFLLVNTILIAFAGIASNLQLYRLLKHLCASKVQALQILFAWLSINLFLGAQLSWNLRPFFGTPHLPVHFLREDAFVGSFYEAVFRLFINSIGG